MSFDSAGDFKEGWANAAEASRVPEPPAHRSEHYTIVSKGVGIKAKIKRKDFREKYPDSDALYKKAYQQMDNDQLRANFKSKDKNVLAAMAIATQRVAEENGITPENLSDLDAKLLENSNFEQHLSDAQAEIENGTIATNKPETLLIWEAEYKQQKKHNRPTAKVASHSVIVKCKKELKCELAAFSIKIENTRDADLFTKTLDVAKRAGTIKALLEKCEVSEVSADGTLDLYPDTAPAQIHLISSRLNFNKVHATITASGSCDHGKADICPSIKLTSDKVKLDKSAGGGLSVEKGHADPVFKTLLLRPKKSNLISDWKSFVELLKQNDEIHSPATYHISVLSHSPGSPYTGYQSALKVYPFSQLAFTALIEFGAKPSVSISTLIRQDDNDTRFGYSGSPEQFLSDLTQTTWLMPAFTTMGLLFRVIGALSVDADEDAEDLDHCIDTDAEPESELNEVNEDSGPQLQTPVLNMAYRRTLVNLAQYSGVDWKEEIYLSASPLLKWQREINLINLLCKVSLSAVTLGASDAAQGAKRGTDTLLTHLGVKEHIMSSFENAKVFFRQIAKDIKKATVGDGEIPSVFAGEGTPTKTTVECKLLINAAIENDNPGAGLVYSREPGGEWAWDRENTSIYGGANFQVSGKVSSDLNILKTIGFGSAIDEVGGTLNIQSADGTGEVRFALNMTADPGKQYRAHEEISKDGKIDNPKVKDELETAEGEAPQGSPFACSFNWIFSGIGIYLEAYITIAEKSNETDDRREQRQSTSRNTTRSMAGGSCGLSGTSSLGKKKRISFQVLKARESKPRTWVLPLDKIVNKK